MERAVFKAFVVGLDLPGNGVIPNSLTIQTTGAPLEESPDVYDALLAHLQDRGSRITITVEVESRVDARR